MVVSAFNKPRVTTINSGQYAKELAEGSGKETKID